MILYPDPTPRIVMYGDENTLAIPPLPCLTVDHDIVLWSKLTRPFATSVCNNKSSQGEFSSHSLESEDHGVPLADPEILQINEKSQGRLDLQRGGNVDAALLGGGSTADNLGCCGPRVTSLVHVPKSICKGPEEISYCFVEHGSMG